MNIVLWVASGLVALAMVAAGGVKVVVPRVKLLDKMAWAKTWSDSLFKWLGLAEVLGGVGVILPFATGILPVLSPIAAVCLAILMGGAVKTHVALKESPMVPGILAVLAVFVALGRFGVF